MFEGEYLNGKRNGIGNEYFYNGNIKFFLINQNMMENFIKDIKVKERNILKIY